MFTVRDLPMIQKAFEERFPMKPEIREKIIDRLVRIMDDGDNEDAIKAAKVLLIAIGIDVRSAHLAAQQQAFTVAQEQQRKLEDKDRATVTPDEVREGIRRLLSYRPPEPGPQVNGHGSNDLGLEYGNQ